MDNKVSQRINDIVGDNVKKIAQLFPSAVKDGEVDFEALKEELGEFREVDSEKYELTWAGKKNAKKIAQEEVFGRTLKFIPEDSKDIDTTENLYIEGDNLEVLKLLRQNYYGAVKMIYIDPPYNTGNDFVYMDNFVSAKEESDMSEGHFDEEGNRLVVNRSEEHTSELQSRFDLVYLHSFPTRRSSDLLYIEGDNLEVLKLLRQNYYGAVKMIYIDPPYNTGNDFVYMDNFVSAKEESDMSEGHFDEEGNRLVVN